MTDAKASPVDLTKGIDMAALPDGGMVLGRVGDEDVAARASAATIFAVGANCTHYHGPLAEGLSSATPCAARGTTPASACAPAKRCAHPRSIRSPAGASSAGGDRCSSGRSCRERVAPASRAMRDRPSSVVIVGGGARGPGGRRHAAPRRL